ncbi:hypothetical protein Taro_005366 [Colocasia esculenta]|uniref:Transcription initiation factor TFIID subunit 12 domain-containing protein n=1 Tax=Colocasia esculenta TaxID=4460 RepID=A0A843TS75_COLES|nr:hypothetical protein [Colocasia esculenta]
MESTEPPPATTAPPPSDPAPPPATAPETEAAVASNPPAPSSQQQPQPSTSSSAAAQGGTPKNPQSAPSFLSLQQPANLSSQTQPPPTPQSQLQSHFQTQPQPQIAAPQVAPSPQAQSLPQPQPAQPPQPRPPQPGRPLRPTQPSFSSHFPTHVSSPAATAAGPSSPLPSAAPSLPSSSGPLPRGGMAIGVPAALHHQRPPQQGPVSFASFGPPAPFAPMFNGLPRGSLGVPNQAASTGTQVKQPVQAIPSGGVVGAHSVSSMRPGGVPGSNQQRPGHLTLRTASPSSTQSSTGQKFQSHVLIRGPSASSSGSTLPGPSQSSQPLQQPWMSAPGRPTNPSSLSTPSYRPQNKAQASQKTLAPATLQQGATQPSPISPTSGMDVGEPGNRIISKRSIHELVTQIDPSEKLDPEVEDILVEIAEDFVESITTFGCALARHRKSTTLEAKDILLHLERNWNMTIPGFGGDEIKCYKKPFTNDIHKERLSLVYFQLFFLEKCYSPFHEGVFALLE